MAVGCRCFKVAKVSVETAIEGINAVYRRLIAERMPGNEPRASSRPSVVQ